MLLVSFSAPQTSMKRGQGCANGMNKCPKWDYGVKLQVGYQSQTSRERLSVWTGAF